MNRNNREVDMIHGPMAMKILLFALPLAASSVLQQLFNSADLAVVGRFADSNAMAAVGSNAPVISLMVNLFVGLSVGTNVVLGNLLGSGRRQEIHDALHTAVTLALLSGFILIGAGFILARPLLTLMGAPAEVLELAVLYLHIYFCGMPMIMLYNFGAAILRSRGDSRRPFLCLTLAGILNVCLNLVFVIGFHLSVVGVALATVLSNCVSGGLVIFLLTREEGEFKLRLRDLKIDPRFFKGILRVGVPAGLQGMVFSFSNVVIQSAVNSFGAACIAGMSVAQNMDFISYCTLNAFTQSCVTFTSQNYGAGNRDRCRKVLQLSVGMAMAVDAVVIGTMILFRHPLVGLFTKDPEVVSFAMTRLVYVGFVHFMCGFYDIPGGAMRGMNRSLVPAFISAVGTVGFRLIYVFAILPMHRTVVTLMLVYPLSWILTSIAMNIAYGRVYRKAFRFVKDGPEAAGETS